MFCKFLFNLALRYYKKHVLRYPANAEDYITVFGVYAFDKTLGTGCLDDDETLTSYLKDSTPLTIAATFEQAQEMGGRLLFLDNYPHFSRWCTCHSRNPEDENAWTDYCTLMAQSFEDDSENGGSLSDDKSFIILPMVFSVKTLAILLRKEYHSIPIGLSFEEIDRKVLKDYADYEKSVRCLIAAEGDSPTECSIPPHLRSVLSRKIQLFETVLDISPEMAKEFAAAASPASQRYTAPSSPCIMAEDTQALSSN